MAAVAGLTRAIAGLSVGQVNRSSITIPAAGSTCPSSACAFVSFNGLSSERSFWKVPTFNAQGSKRKETPFEQLVVHAREPTRRESVKVRHRRIRKKLCGTTERPRLAVFRSGKHLYAQVIDDMKHITLCATSTLKPQLKEELKLSSGSTVTAARRVGEEIAKLCMEKGVTKVAYDRGGFVYHGRIKALAEAAREGGLEF
eukprot:TRINITY_DN3663_c0_g2_i2.p1 TRINITY_DN3663_c0_g2~~TRINITY_DN3663_c0_g2_i2.p1  ORF type:complete len:219 (-),score=38.11 TRINITY_DN3663_c0_g2_i2:178-777(-)